MKTAQGPGGGWLVERSRENHARHRRFFYIGSRDLYKQRVIIALGVGLGRFPLILPY